MKLFRIKKPQSGGKLCAYASIAVGVLSLLLCILYSHGTNVDNVGYGFIVSLLITALAGLGIGAGVRSVIVLRHMQSTKYVVFAYIGIVLSFAATLYLVLYSSLTN